MKTLESETICSMIQKLLWTLKWDDLTRWYRVLQKDAYGISTENTLSLNVGHYSSSMFVIICLTIFLVKIFFWIHTTQDKIKVGLTNFKNKFWIECNIIVDDSGSLRYMRWYEDEDSQESWHTCLWILP